MGRSGVKQGNTFEIANAHQQLHRLGSADSGNREQGNLEFSLVWLQVIPPVPRI